MSISEDEIPLVPQSPTRHIDSSQTAAPQTPGKRRGATAITEAEEDAVILKETLEADEEKEHHIRFTSQPSFINNNGKKMRDYQVEALNWLIRLHDTNINGILADEMGLGKTLECIAMLGFLKHQRGINGPHLIVVPKSTISNWINEIHSWVPTLKTFRFHGDKETRIELKEKILNEEFDVCVTTYEMAIIEKSLFMKFKWHYLVIDEAHRVKNENSILAKIVRVYYSKHRVLLTGTPLQNNLHELWALLNFLLPKKFASGEDFEESFNITNTDERDKIVDRLHRVLRPYLLRRLKSDVEKALPPKKEIKLWVQMAPMQRRWYKDILMKNLDALNASSCSRVRLLNIVMQLRKCCNHPYLFDGAEPGPPYFEGDHIINNSGKFVLLDKLLKRLKLQGRRVLVFSQMTRLLDILEDYCFFRGWQYCRLDGSTPQDVRDQQMDVFNAPNSPKFIFLLSTRAGGLGVNLQTADTVVLYDSDWNPQMDLQAQDRAHRIGQKKKVLVYRFVTEGTVEQKIIDRADSKLFLDALVIQQGRLMEKNQQAGSSELMNMVKFGADEIFHATNIEITDQDIDAIISRGEERTQEINEKLQKSAAHTLSSFSVSDKVEESVYMYEGQDYHDMIVGPSFRFIEPPKRARKENYDINAYYKGVFATREGDRSQHTREYVPPTRYDFQFFNNIEELEEIEKKDHCSRQRFRQLKLDYLWAEKEEKKRQKEDKNESRAGSHETDLDKTVRSDTPALVAALSDKSDSDKTVRSDTPALVAALSGKSDSDKIDSNDRSETPFESIPDNTDNNKYKKPQTKVSLDDDTIERLRKQAGCITEDELKRKNNLIEAGFGHWSRRDFMNFVKACETYGRKNIKSLHENVPGKMPDEIDSYSEVFWTRGKEELKEWDRIIQQIKRGEQKIVRQTRIQEVVARKVNTTKGNILTRMSIKYPSQTSSIRIFSEEEDRFLVLCCHEFGYGNWVEMRLAIRRSPWFRFDWFLKSRTPVEIGRRCDYLVKIIEQEYKEKDIVIGKRKNGTNSNNTKKKAKSRKY